MHRVADHSTFSQNRRRRLQEVDIFREIFNDIVLKCIEFGIAGEDTGVADGSFLHQWILRQPCKYQELRLNGGCDIGAVHRGLELLGFQGYTAILDYQNNAMKKGFCYEEESDRFVCKQ